MASRNQAEPRPDGRLKSWKAIAAFFGANERTVKRWEANRGLPVRRVPGGAKSTVYADVEELERWLGGREALAAGAQQPRRLRRWLRWAAPAALALAALPAILLWPAAEPATRAHRAPPEAVEAYLAGMFNWGRRTPQSLRQAERLFAAAIARDPDYAEAHAGLANTYLLLREYTPMPDAEAFQRARAAAQRALALAPDLAQANVAMGFIACYWERDFPRGLALFRRAARLDPRSAHAQHWYATALYHAGDIRAALTVINQAQRLEPTSHAVLADKGLILFHAGRRDEAVLLLNQIAAADPNFYSSHYYLALIHLAAGDYPAYLDEARLAATVQGSADQQAIVAAGRAGWERGGAPAMLRAMLERQQTLRADGRLSAFELAGTHALLGERAAAIRLLRASEAAREPHFLSIRMDPRFRSLHGDPEYRRLASALDGPGER